MPAAGLSEGQVALYGRRHRRRRQQRHGTGSFTEDLTAPVATIGLKHDAADDTGSSSPTASPTTPSPSSSARATSLSGTVDVTVTDAAGHKLTYTAATDASGNWSIDTRPRPRPTA